MAHTVRSFTGALCCAGLISILGSGISAPALAGSGLPDHFQLHTPEAQMQTLGTIQFRFHQALRNASISDIRIHEAGLTLPDGRPVTAYDFGKAANVVIGAGGPVSEVAITSIAAVPGGQEILASFHSNMSPHTPLPQHLGVWDLTTFQPLSWQLRPVSTGGHNTIGAWVLSDISGSMEDVLETVKQSAATFLEAMPSYVECSLMAFNHEVYPLSPQPEACPQAAQRVTQMTAGGGTNVFGALQAAYEQAAQAGYQHNLFIVLSDGVQTSDDTTRQAALDAKAKVNGKTLILWTGTPDKTDLSGGLADWDMEAGTDPRQDITAYFQNLQLFVEGQTLIVVNRPGPTGQKEP